MGNLRKIISLSVTFVLICFVSTFGNDFARISRLYEGISGFGITIEDSDKIKESGGSPVYGEITYASVRLLLDELRLTDKDVFYDLGSGVGKLVVQAFLSTPVKKSIGVELSSQRYNDSQKVYDKLLKEKLIQSGRTLRFYNKNIAEVDLSDATVIFMCATCFPKELMQKMTDKFAGLQRSLRIVTLKRLSKNKTFDLVKTISLPMTWSSSSDLYFYEFKKD